MNTMEADRGDQYCTKVTDNQQCILAAKYIFHFKHRGQSKSYRFNVVLDEDKYQQETFMMCSIPVFKIVRCSNS